MNDQFRAVQRPDSEEPGSSAWNLNQLRAGGQTTASFTYAFLQALVAGTLEQLPVTVVSSDPSVPVTNLTGPLTATGAGGTLSFDVGITADGAPHRFELRLVHQDTGEVLGAVPVVLSGRYRYDVEALDPDGDALTYRLLEGPAGADIDPASGVILWQPAAAAAYPFRVQADDGRGGRDEQAFTVNVIGADANHAPKIVSPPLMTVFNGEPYTYDVKAVDPDDDTLSYRLTRAPAGMTIDPATAEIRWVYGVADFGEHDVSVRVEDPSGAFDEQSFRLTVAGGTTAGTVAGTVFEDVNNDGVLTRPIPTTFFGPFHYLSRDDSPFDLSGLGTNFFLEDFEDHEFNVPGVTQTEGNGGVNSIVFGPGLHDSVDADDGAIDGSGLAGDDWWGTAFPGFTFTFDAQVLGRLPTRVGIVETDTSRRTVFEPFDENGDSLGVLFGNYPRGGHAGPTFDDHFFGVIHASGISKIRIEGGIIPGLSSGMEIDHLQYGFVEPPPAVTEPGQAGVAVYLDADDDGRRDPDERSMATDAQGRYVFDGLLPDTYTVRLDLPVGRAVAAPQDGFRRVTVTGGESFTGLDFSTQAAPPPPNRDPDISSTPPTAVAAEETFHYRPAVTDPDGDALQFDLPLRPEGMSIEPLTGTIVWGPTLHQLGVHDVLLRVRDGKGGLELQHWQVSVTAPDTSPFITSPPPLVAVVGHTLEYHVLAQDAEGTDFTFRVDAQLPGVIIDPVTGVLRVTPAGGQGLRWDVRVVATDAGLRSYEQQFHLNVLEVDTPNTAPEITSRPRQQINLGGRYLYEVQVANADFDPLAFSLPIAPAGMAIDTDGMIRWEPAADQLGPNPVTLRVDDGRGGIAEQAFTVTVVSQLSNRPPVIISTPRLSVAVGGTYVYDGLADDPDGDPIAWRLVSAPQGTSIGQRGTLRWTPRPDQLGQHQVVIEAVDAQGGVASQSFTVTVRASNLPPAITTSPPTEGFYSRPYVYAVGATDPEGDPLTFTLLSQPPPGLVMDAAGVIRWTPPDFLNPDPLIVIRAEDGQGGVAEQEYTIALSFPSNQAPEVTSSPPLAATVGEAYLYQLAATDPDGDAPLTFALPLRPAGMTIDDTGLLTWTPTASDLGYHEVTVAVFDPFGAGWTQTYTLRVLGPNNAPAITSTPLDGVTAGLTYRYDVRASDPDGEPLTFALTAAPAGMAIDARGRITWATSPAAAGPHHVEVTATDPRGLSAGQTFDVTVRPDTQAPRVQLVLTSDRTAVGVPLTAVVTASDDVTVAALDLTVGGVPLALDANGRATIVQNSVGSFDVVATARDAAGNTGMDAATLLVFDPSVTGAPTVSLTSPDDGAEVTAPRDVIGTANDDNLLLWTLAVAPAGTSSFIEIARGTTPVIDGVLGQLDPSLLTNDSYTLRLTATDAGRNTATAERIVNVSGNLKLGNFTLSFTDLSIPVSGIPIQVTRTYDTIQASQAGEVGFGWRLEFRDTRLRTSLPKTGLEADGIFTPFRDGTKVYVTLPGGRREGFTFRPKEEKLIHTRIYIPQFVADAGVTSQLAPAGRTILFRRGNEYVTAEGLAYNPADPTFGGGYILTTREGIQYHIDGITGLMETVTDRNGNTLSFSEGGIVSSTGEAVTFARDPQGRIVSITDPMGQSIGYQYDVNGDLVAISDRMDNTTQIVYRTDRPHYLEQVIDPLGRTGARTEYDEQGRMVQLMNGNGEAVHFTHDLGNLTETILDPRGNPTVYEYDDRGNIVTEINALGGVTHRTYDAENNLVAETDSLGNTTTETYDDAGRILTRADPLGNVIRYRFDAVGNLLTATDPLGNTVAHTFDARGNLLTTRDADGALLSTNIYDARGNLISTTDALGNATSYQYDLSGRRLSATNALGQSVGYTYNASDYPISQSTIRTDAAGNLVPVNIAYALDQANRLTAQTDPDGTSIESEYDELGRQSGLTDRLGNGNRYEHDAAGNLVAVFYPDGTVERSALRPQP